MKTLLSLLLAGAAAWAADPAPNPVGQVLDRQLSMLERELVPLAEASLQIPGKVDNAEVRTGRPAFQRVTHAAPPASPLSPLHQVPVAVPVD